MKKEEIDKHLEALLGAENVNRWWHSPNRYFNSLPPITIYEESEEGKKRVEEYVICYCYGK